tara:strand:+ start:201 stop:335 length:135 start_codon:yes stop_codon:yes gene_type:complete
MIAVLNNAGFALSVNEFPFKVAIGTAMLARSHVVRHQINPFSAI